MAQLKSIGVLSLAKIYALIMAVFGLIIGIFYGFGMMAPIGFSGGMMSGAVAGFLFVILMPVFYGVLGFVSGAITALLYNMFAKWVGGVEVDLK